MGGVGRREKKRELGREEGRWGRETARERHVYTHRERGEREREMLLDRNNPGHRKRSHCKLHTHTHLRTTRVTQRLNGTAGKAIRPGVEHVQNYTHLSSPRRSPLIKIIHIQQKCARPPTPTPTPLPRAKRQAY